MARPRKEIERSEFEKLCGMQCTKEEICGWFDVTDKTLETWCRREYKQGFSEVFTQKRGLGKISLRRAQFQLAQKSAAMAIFLGKNYLGQTDRQEIVHGNAGQLADLIDGLKEPVYDLHAEAAGVDGAVENESSEAD
jgi:hypothetical protein